MLTPFEIAARSVSEQPPSSLYTLSISNSVDAMHEHTQHRINLRQKEYEAVLTVNLRQTEKERATILQYSPLQQEFLVISLITTELEYESKVQR